MILSLILIRVVLNLTQPNLAVSYPIVTFLLLNYFYYAEICLRCNKIS